MSAPTAPRIDFRDRARYVLRTPLRLFEQRTSVQLIVGYITVVLLVILLLQGTVLAVLLLRNQFNVFPDRHGYPNAFLGEQATAYVLWIGPGTIKDSIDLSPTRGQQRIALTSRLNQIVTVGVPGVGDTTEGSSPSTIHAAILDNQGIVVASSNNWLKPDTDLASLPDADLQLIIAANQALQGRADDDTDTYYTLAQSGETTIAAQPIILGNGTWIGTLVVQGENVDAAYNESRGRMAQQVAVSFMQSLWLLAIPTIIVAIPFGIWRSRVMARRLQRLAGAAEAMAEGNLHTRVRIKRMDEIGRLGESFNQMAQHIDSIDQTRRAFVSNVSHELRTPMSIIQGTAERLAAQPGLTTDQRQGLATIRSEGDMLVRLIDDLFSIARLQEQNLRIVRQSVDVHQLVTDVMAPILETAWMQRKISVENLVSADVPEVWADPQRVRQIISNLIYNAMRHTPEGGLVIVEADTREPGMVEIRVTDTGVGMNADALRHVFTRYFQSERNRRHGEGSGLGLAIVKQLVEAHGGTISVSSKEGQGTTFVFTLPVAKPPRG